MSDQKVQWLREHPHLCTSPYTKRDFRIHRSGFNVSCCCNLDIGYSTKTGSTELVDQVADNINHGQAHPACWRCHDEEKQGHISERIRNLLGYTINELEEFNRTGMQSTELEIGMKFSNLCNLGCRSCASSDSSTFEKITKLKLEISDMSKDLSDMPEHWNVLIEYIREKYKTHDSIIFHAIGGETFVQPGFYRLLDWLIEEDFASRAIMRVTTSFATPLSDLLVEKLLHFKKVELLASVDSVGENYHYVRWPAKFEKVERNLDILTTLYQTHPNKFPVTGIMPIFSLNNIFYLDEILDFWVAWHEAHSIPLFMNTMHLYRPVFLSIDILPMEYRPVLIKILENCQQHKFFKNNNSISSATFNDYIVATIDILKSVQDTDEIIFNDYLKFSADYDKRTGVNSFQGNKKLFDLLLPHHVEIYNQHYNSANVSFPIYYATYDQS